MASQPIDKEWTDQPFTIKKNAKRNTGELLVVNIETRRLTINVSAPVPIASYNGTVRTKDSLSKWKKMEVEIIGRTNLQGLASWFNPFEKS